MVNEVWWECPSCGARLAGSLADCDGCGSIEHGVMRTGDMPIVRCLVCDAALLSDGTCVVCERVDATTCRCGADHRPGTPCPECEDEPSTDDVIPPSVLERSQLAVDMREWLQSCQREAGVSESVLMSNELDDLIGQTGRLVQRGVSMADEAQLRLLALHRAAKNAYDAVDAV